MLLLEKIKQFFSNKEAEKLDNIIKQSDLESDKNSFYKSPIKIEDGMLNYDPFQIYQYQGQSFLIDASTMNQKIKEWRLMSEIPEVDEAIDIIVNELIAFDGINDPIKINLDDLEISNNIKEKIEESFNKCLKLLNFNKNGYEIIRKFYIDGQINFKAIYDEKVSKNGIIDLIYLTPFNFFKYIDPQTKEVKWFYTKGDYSSTSFVLASELSKSVKQFLDEEIIHADSGKFSTDGTFPISYLNKAIKAINQLTLIEDALVIYRITRATERRAFYVDVGNLPKTKAEQYIQNLITKYRQKNVYDVRTGRIEGATKTISVIEDYWFPVSGNRGSRVETISPGNLTFTDIDDLNYFEKKIYRALNIPYTRKTEGAVVSFSASSEIERDEIRFAKFIIRLRNKFANLFLEFLKRDLLYTKVFSLNDWENIKENIKFIFNSDNDYAEIKNLDKWESRFNLLNTADDLRERGYLSKNWIVKNILRFTEDEYEEIKKEIDQEQKENPEENEEEY